MSRMLFLLTILLLLVGCGPKISIEVDPEQTRVIYDEEIEMVSFYVLVKNTGQLPANNLYARFLIDHPALQQAVGGMSDFLFLDSHGNIERFKLSADSSYFIAEAFSLEADITEEDLINSVTVQIYDNNDQVVAEYPIAQVTNE